MKTMKTAYFFGNKVSEYGLENGYVDYSTLAKSFDAVLNNDIMAKIGFENFELVNGSDYNDETDEYTEIYQCYIISDAGLQILQDYTDEIVYRSEDYDLNIWCVTHYGTGWTHVLTNIEINPEEE
ncbi:MAG: hypothetical protein MJ126_04600 [Lachnospiraceae bacterium]|nr:hypothetical protein [Lachnospiraceae bacterium]